MSATARTHERARVISLLDRGAHRSALGCSPLATVPTGPRRGKAVDFEPSDNLLLGTLQVTDLQALKPFLKPAEIDKGRVLFEVGEEFEHVYFPVTGMISLLFVMKDGRSAETASIGRDSGVGLTNSMKPQTSLLRAIVPLPFTGFVCTSRNFRKVARDSAGVRNIVLKSALTILGKNQVIAACNALHTIESRVCRWILQARDNADDRQFAFTQEFIAEMLAVRRTSVTDVAKKLQSEGIIRYSRGRLEISNRVALERRTCECYACIRERSHAVLSETH